jgi:hypothetical protein
MKGDFKMDGKDALISSILIFVVIFLILFQSTKGISDIRQEAIKNGVGYYSVNNEGISTFHFIRVESGKVVN